MRAGVSHGMGPSFKGGARRAGHASAGARQALRIMVLEDDFGDFDAVFRALRKMEAFDCEIVRARTIVEARLAAARTRFDVVFVDYHLGADSGLVFLQENGGRIGGALTILMTGVTECEIHSTALDAGAMIILNKRDISTSLLETTIRSARYAHSLEQRLQALIAELGGARTSRSAGGGAGAGAGADADGSASGETGRLREIARRAEAIIDRHRSTSATPPAEPVSDPSMTVADAETILSLARAIGPTVSARAQA